jgi:hypothetical protein
VCRNHVSISGKKKGFNILQRVETGSGFHPASYAVSSAQAKLFLSVWHTDTPTDTTENVTYVFIVHILLTSGHDIEV